MKFRVTMKTPDALARSIASEAAQSDDYEDDLMDLCGKWFEYEEYLTVEIDTEKETCVVVPVRK